MPRLRHANYFSCGLPSPPSVHQDEACLDCHTQRLGTNSAVRASAEFKLFFSFCYA
ncbi:hypothetical protein PAHAL_5G384000 [Panicum hallii]|uniref:Uncharacterized protein n=1 Tax=Panicum hallii TaxID=206008 RepID=A0A2T8IMP6_9POAL|nr:hypothetical protein PAHAL_5G384000 [Panicum hallii]